MHYGLLKIRLNLFFSLNRIQMAEERKKREERKRLFILFYFFEEILRENGGWWDNGRKSRAQSANSVTSENEIMSVSSSSTDTNSSVTGEKIMYARPNKDMWKNPFPSSNESSSVSTKVESSIGVFIMKMCSNIYLD
jgi:hypothetical protein